MFFESLLLTVYRNLRLKGSSTERVHKGGGRAMAGLLVTILVTAFITALGTYQFHLLTQHVIRSPSEADTQSLRGRLLKLFEEELPEDAKQPPFIMKANQSTFPTIAQFFNRSHGVTHLGVKWTLMREANPRMLYLHQVLSRDEAEEIITYAKPHLERSQVNDNVKFKGGLTSQVRTSSGMFLSQYNGGPMRGGADLPANVKLRHRVQSVMGIPEDAWMEATQVLQYQHGGHYFPHMDAFNEHNYNAMSRGGQRAVTVVTWLNDNVTGGSTTLPRALPDPISMPPRAGDAFIFFTLKEDAVTVDPCSQHGSVDVEQGEKYVAIQWTHLRPFN